MKKSFFKLLPGCAYYVYRQQSESRKESEKRCRTSYLAARSRGEERENASNMRAYAVLFRPWNGSAPFYTGNHFYISFCDRMPGAGIQFILLLEHAGRQHTKKLRNLV